MCVFWTKPHFCYKWAAHRIYPESFSSVKRRAPPWSLLKTRHFLSTCLFIHSTACLWELAMGWAFAAHEWTSHKDIAFALQNAQLICPLVIFTSSPWRMWRWHFKADKVNTFFSFIYAAFNFHMLLNTARKHNSGISSSLYGQGCILMAEMLCS